MNKKIASLSLHKDSAIKDAMECIDKSGKGIVLIVDKNRKLCGILTDGDIRRALLTGNNFKTPVKTIMITNPIKTVKILIKIVKIILLPKNSFKKY